MTEYAKCKHGILAFQFCGACRQDTDARVQQLQHENSVLMQSRRELIRVNDDLRDQLADAEKALAQERARADMAAMRLETIGTAYPITDEQRLGVALRMTEQQADSRIRRAEHERDRLREALEGDNLTAKRVYKLLEQRDELAAENEKLVKALNEIAAWDFHAEGPQAGSQAPSMRIARKALADAGRGREGK